MIYKVFRIYFCENLAYSPYQTDDGCYCDRYVFWYMCNFVCREFCSALINLMRWLVALCISCLRNYIMDHHGSGYTKLCTPASWYIYGTDYDILFNTNKSKNLTLTECLKFMNGNQQARITLMLNYKSKWDLNPRLQDYGQYISCPWDAHLNHYTNLSRPSKKQTNKQT